MFAGFKCFNCLRHVQVFRCREDNHIYRVQHLRIIREPLSNTEPFRDTVKRGFVDVAHRCNPGFGYRRERLHISTSPVRADNSDFQLIRHVCLLPMSEREYSSVSGIYPLISRFSWKNHFFQLFMVPFVGNQRLCV